jgi:hypothetical protein
MMQTQVTIGAWPNRRSTTLAATKQEKSDENTDKSGPYDDKRNIIACEEVYCPKVDVKLTTSCERSNKGNR